MDLSGAVAIVTGGNGGLGRRICRSLALEGVDVAVVYASDAAAAGEVVSGLRTLDVKAVAVRCDISQGDQVRAMVRQTVDSLGRVDILVNNAAYYGGLWEHFLDIDLEDTSEWDRSLAINLTGPMLCTRAVADLMKRQGRGRIVNISTVGSFQAAAYSVAYITANAGLNHLTRCTAAALAPEVLVNCIAPGFMEGTRATGLIPQEMQDVAVEASSLRRAVDKDDVANQVGELCRTDSITGQTLLIDAGRVFH